MGVREVRRCNFTVVTLQRVEADARTNTAAAAVKRTCQSDFNSLL